MDSAFAPLRTYKNGTMAAAKMDIPLEAAVTAAVVTLYREKAEPAGKLVQFMVKRLFGLDASVQSLRTCAKTTPGLCMQPPSATRFPFAIFLAVQPEDFQGFAKDLDHSDFLDVSWDTVRDFLASGAWPLADVPEHQAFEIACWLRSHTRLNHTDLGTMLAVVKFASNGLQLLGKQGNRLVKYDESDDYQRRCNMLAMCPTGVKVGERYVATWEALRSCLRILLRDVAYGGKAAALDISRLKGFFRERFSAELSETAFGCATLSELMSHSNLAHDFRVTSKNEPNGVKLLSLAPNQDERVSDRFAPVQGFRTFALPFKPPTSLGTFSHDSFILKRKGIPLTRFSGMSLPDLPEDSVTVVSEDHKVLIEGKPVGGFEDRSTSGNVQTVPSAVVGTPGGKLCQEIPEASTEQEADAVHTPRRRHRKTGKAGQLDDDIAVTPPRLARRHSPQFLDKSCHHFRSRVLKTAESLDKDVHTDCKNPSPTRRQEAVRPAQTVRGLDNPTDGVLTISSLPSWCSVRHTFINVTDVGSIMPNSVRSQSLPPHLTNSV
jgi:hypothetical protein